MKSNVAKHFNKNSLGDKIRSACLMLLIGNTFKIHFNFKNVQIINGDILQNSVFKNSKKRPLLTVMNHRTLFDEFFIMGGLLPNRILAEPEKIRYTVVAEDIIPQIFRVNSILSSGKVVPLWRNTYCRTSGSKILQGLGVWQPSMDFLIDVLNTGGWVNIYAQGRIIYGHEIIKEKELRLRRGIGRLISESSNMPIVLPIWHCGLDQFYPVKWNDVARYFLRMLNTDHKVTIYIGCPISVSLMSQIQLNKMTKEEKMNYYNYVTNIVQEELYEVRGKALDAHANFIK